MTNKELKEKYKSEYIRIKEFMNQFDPCGLILSGAPGDEYDKLTNQVIGLITKGASTNLIKGLILNEVENYFGFEIPSKEPYKSDFENALNEFISKAMNPNQNHQSPEL